MPLTLTVVHAPIGGAAAVLPEVATAAVEGARSALGPPEESAYVGSAHGMLTVVLRHEAGERDGDVHRAAWEALDAGMQGARAIGPAGLGDGLPVDAFPGSLHATGVATAEIVLTEQPVGPVVVLLGNGTATGAFNLPLLRGFADPFTTPRLAQAPLRRGFIFEVHDLEEPRKRMFAAPADLYDLVATLGDSARYLVKSVVTAEGALAAVASSSRRSDILGPSALADCPVAIVRTGGDVPTVAELLTSFETPQVVSTPTGALATVAPVGLATPALGPSVPSVVALGFHLGPEALLPPTDLFAGPAFEGARRKARNVASILGAGGALTPRVASASSDAPAGDAGRWSER